MPKDEPTSHNKSHKKEKKKLKSVYVDTDQQIDSSEAGLPNPPPSRPEEKAVAGSDALVNEDADSHRTAPSLGGRENFRYVVFRCAECIAATIAAVIKAIFLPNACSHIYFSFSFVLGPCRLELGPQFEPVQVEPALICSDFDADTHELWLLQLPLDVWSLTSSA